MTHEPRGARTPPLFTHSPRNLCKAVFQVASYWLYTHEGYVRELTRTTVAGTIRHQLQT